MRKIFYYCYDHNQPTGGEKHSYQHVDVLNDSGFDAYVYHRQPGVRLSWFENDTRVVSGEQFASLYDPDRDVLVFPEDLGAGMLHYPGRRVIFNKNVFHGFKALGLGVDPVIDPATIGILAVSDHNASWLRFAYPAIPVHRVYAYIRGDLFTSKAFREKKPQIVTVAKSESMLAAIYRMFTARASMSLNGGAAWEWLVLSGKSEREVAACLADSPVLLFLSIEEGLPRLPLEAMSCNCLVGAFRCGPLIEVLAADQGFPYGDIDGMLRWLEGVVGAFPENTEKYDDVLAVQKRNASEFTQSRQRASVCAAWTEILAKL